MGKEGEGWDGLCEGCGEVISAVGKERVLFGREEYSLSRVTHCLPLLMKDFSQTMLC